MKYILSSFGLNNPYVAAEIPDHAVYPIGLEEDRSIDLDYSMLLIGTGFLVDQSAIDYLTEHADRLPFLAPMLYSIQRLTEEGLLETFDGRSIIASHSAEIIEKTERLCEDLGWIQPVRAQWNALREDREEFLKKFGTAEKRTLNEHHFAVLNAARRIDGTQNPTLIAEIAALVNSRRLTFSRREVELVREVLRPLVCHTVIQDLFRYKNQGALLDWEDSQSYYEKLYASRWEKDSDRVLAYHTRALFEFSLPELRPQSVDAVVKFVRDNRNVVSLRDDVSTILMRGEKFDPQLGKKLLSEVFGAELAVKKKMKWVKLLGAVVSLIIPGGSLLTEAAVEGATTFGEDAIEGAIQKPHRWLYSLRRE